MIKVLPKEVSDKIAAGEVIENPVSILKELIENSIDAGATSITCEIKKGGKEEIRITDNGCGIPANEVEVAFLRHATSKIERADDLNNLTTLGFRGEALASIAAVTRTELITKIKDENVGTKIIIHGGTIINKESIGCPSGTTIIAKDLFYNTPARGKFLKSEAAETGRIIDMVSRLAITSPDIKFTLISNGKNIFTTTGNGDLKNAILSVYRDREYKDLVKVQSDEESNISVYGFISRPSFTRSNRRSQIYFVNRRIVKNDAIEKGIDLGYKERVFEGRYPIAFLFIDINPEKLDVNVHPNKREVRFNDDIQVISAVETAVRNAITTKDSVVKAVDSLTKAIPNDSLNSLKGSNPNDFKSRNESDQVNIREYLSSKDNKPFEIKEEAFTYDAYGESISEDLVENKYIQEYFDFNELTFGETIFGTYITATDENNFYLFDQHAAHERVNYEKLLNGYLSKDKESQILLTPLILDTPLELYDFEKEWIDTVDEMGYNVEPFGENTYIVREIPIFMTLKEAEDFLKSFIDEYLNDKKINNTVVIDKLISKACKSSIKAHDYIKNDEIEALIDDLKLCNNPFSCPHGRPTFIKFTKYDIEKMFKRVN